MICLKRNIVDKFIFMLILVYEILNWSWCGRLAFIYFEINVIFFIMQIGNIMNIGK